MKLNLPYRFGNNDLIMRNLIVVVFFVSVALGFFACKDNNSQEKLRENELELLRAYIAKNHPGAEPTKTGLYFFELKKGLGDTIKVGDRVQCYYKTMDISENVLDESNGYSQGYRYEPLEFFVGAGSVISGLEEGVTYMTTGAKAKLVINSQLAYKTQGDGTGAIGSFTTLVMEVEIYKVFHRK